MSDHIGAQQSLQDDSSALKKLSTDEGIANQNGTNQENHDGNEVNHSQSDALDSALGTMNGSTPEETPSGTSDVTVGVVPDLPLDNQTPDDGTISQLEGGGEPNKPITTYLSFPIGKSSIQSQPTQIKVVQTSTSAEPVQIKEEMPTNVERKPSVPNVEKADEARVVPSLKEQAELAKAFPDLQEPEQPASLFHEEEPQEDNRVSRILEPTMSIEEALRIDGLPLPDTVVRLQSVYGSLVYLVGTAHFSKQSQEDVAITIQRVRPDIVVLELCDSRASLLHLDEEAILKEAKDLNWVKMKMIFKEHGTVQGIMYILLLSLSAHITKQLGMAPGGEFRTAYNEAALLPFPCVVILGDRPIHITLARALASLSLWQKAKLFCQMIMCNDSISVEDVEKCKERDVMEQMMAELTGEFPPISEVFVKERDLFLTRALQEAAVPRITPRNYTGKLPRRVVGVVGIGHMEGIMNVWGNVSAKELIPLRQVPPPTWSQRICVASVKFGFYSLIAFGAYKCLPSSAKSTLKVALKSTLRFTINSSSSYGKFMSRYVK